ncbi:histidine kinase N-terminal 7TM domain-containing diguanylate cyclase [Pseudokineococcus sp. 1T1Z-3]|uniref:histidine kinase N-terminal 7TM domain-containing diguanylate cyclase n=1 Tax=Pseudokineococcus sp. 1T1Z-3 TaxID=3132745 RepID=UPI00309E58A0
MAPVVLATCLLAAAVTARTAVLVGRRRDTGQVAVSLTVLLCGVTAWCVLAGVRALPLPLLVERVLDVPFFLSVCLSVALIVVFVHVRSGRPVTRRLVAVLSVEPALVALALLLDPWLHVFYAEVTVVGDPPVRVDEYGPGFWVHALYSWGLVAGATAVTWRTRRRATGELRRQGTLLVVASVVPASVDVLSVVFSDATASLPLTPLAFVVTGVVFTLATVRQDLLQLVPVACAQVVDTLSDAVWVLGTHGRVVDANPAALELVSSLRPGGRLDVHAAAGGDLPPELVGPGRSSGDVVVALPGGRELDVRTRDVRARSGRLVGRVVVARDTTAQRTARRQLEEANLRLEAHVATIETLRAALEVEAAQDPLTGLLNRRGLWPLLRASLRTRDEGGPEPRGACGERPVTVVLLDLDHFKHVNDVHGHGVGDDLLVDVARRLRAAASGHPVARWGGEELLVLLEGVAAEEAEAVADRLRRACGRASVELPDGTCVRATASAGVATWPTSATSAEELLLRADEGLYAAKAGGRDRVASAPPWLGEVPAQRRASRDALGEARAGRADRQVDVSACRSGSRRP